MAGNIPVTGLTMLGQQILSGADDYVGRQRQLQDEARRRAERLTDVSSQRDYETATAMRQRDQLLADQQRQRFESLTDAGKREALQNRFKMLDEAERRGLIAASDLGKQDVEDAAIQTLATQLSSEAKFSQAQPGNAAARLQELGQTEQQLTRKLADVEARLSSQPTIDPNAVQNTAIQMATQMNGGKPPSREQIQQALPDAQAKAQQQATLQWYQDKNDAQVQQQLLTSQLNTIRQQQANLTSTFKVAPSPTPAAPVVPPTTLAPAAPTGAPLDSFLKVLNTRTPPPPPSANSNLTLQDVGTAMKSAPPSAVPALRQARTSMLADAYGQLDDPANSTAAKLAGVQDQIQRVQSGLNPLQGVTPAPLDVTPEVQGQYLTRLILQQGALQRQLDQEKQARTTGRANLLSGLQISTPTQSVPITPPSPGSVLSDPYSFNSPVPAGLF